MDSGVRPLHPVHLRAQSSPTVRLVAVSDDPTPALTSRHRAATAIYAPPVTLADCGVVWVWYGAPGLAAGAAAGVTAGLGARRWLGDRPGRALLAGVAAGALAWLLISELTWPAVRGFWQRHPSWSATVTSATLLALTALIIERAVEVREAGGRDRRWRAAGRAACEALLGAVADPVEEQRDDIFWRASQIEGHGPEGRGGRDPRSAPVLRQAVLAVAAVMTATESLHDVYLLALAALQTAADLDRATLDMPPAGSLVEAPWEHESRRLAWWTATSGQWDRLGDALRAFEDAAIELLGELRIFDDREAPWRTEDPPGFTAALRSFREDYPGL